MTLWFPHLPNLVSCDTRYRWNKFADYLIGALSGLDGRARYLLRNLYQPQTGCLDDIEPTVVHRKYNNCPLHGSSLTKILTISFLLRCLNQILAQTCSVQVNPLQDLRPQLFAAEPRLAAAATLASGKLPLIRKRRRNNSDENNHDREEFHFGVVKKITSPIKNHKSDLSENVEIEKV